MSPPAGGQGAVTRRPLLAAGEEDDRAPVAGVEAADLRLVPAALAAWASAGAAVALPAGFSLLVALLLGVAVVGLLRAGGRAGRPAGPRRLGVTGGRGDAGGRTGAGRRRDAGRRGPSPARSAVAVVLLVAAVVAATTALRVAERDGGLVPDLVARSAVVEVVGRVAGEPAAVRPREGSWGDGRPRFVVRVVPEQVTGRGVVAPARGALLVVGGVDLGERSRDEVVHLVGRLSPAERGDDVVAVLRLVGGVRAVEPPTGWRATAASLRGGLHDAVAGRGDDARGLLPGLVVGDTSRMPQDLSDDMRTTGLAHLTAVSGGNTAVLVAAVAAGAALLGARRRLRTALALTALVAFVGVAGPDPSVLRAGVMASAALLGVVAGRPGRGVPLLAAAVVVLVVADPWASRSVGFALSVLGTGALLLLAAPWADALSRVLPARLAMAVAVPAAAQALCAPVLLLLAPEVSLAAVPANLLAAPAVAPATVLGVAALAVAPLSATAAQVLALPAAWAVGWVALVARTGAGVPGAALPWPGGWGGAALLSGVLLAGLVLAPAAVSVGRHLRVRHLRVWDPRARDRPGGDRREGGRRGGTRPQRASTTSTTTARGVPRWRRATALTAAALLVVAGLGLLLARTGVRGGAWPPPGWVAVQCDVGQGAALVVRSGPEAAVVVDAGPDPPAVDGCLDRLGVRRVDLLVLTHFHADHVDGLPGVLDGREVTRAVVSPLAVPSAAAQEVAAQLAAEGVPSERGEAGLAGVAGQVPWRVLGPAAGRYPRDAHVPGADGAGEGDGANDASVVVRLDVVDPGGGGAVSVVALGDLGAGAQAQLRRATAADLGAWPVDVLGVAHHGSADQDPGLAALASPRVGLVGVGANTYGHPTPSALQLYADVGALVACTTATGDVAVAGTPGSLTVVPRRRVAATC
ncbi:ComEC/Rec2 family competence protein [Pseudokineococcus sp. 1T1Z-3]|uniref:ComEC/Rec2 family competence protein n=1 Tax=Pseudokineococcus sp. 1T1Z-3 TaxID=3132745 RepID=UPI00309FABA5